MFKILIVEDNTDKLRDILKTLEPIYNVDEIEHVVDSLEAKRKLKDNFYDLLILDIAIPLRKSEVIDLEGGIKLLQEIHERDFYKIPSHIIGLTINEEIFSKATSEFGNHILSVIRYSETDIEWQGQLLKGVDNRIKSKQYSTSIKEEYNYDIAIINAVETEFNAIKALSSNWEKVNIASDSSPYFETTFTKGEKIFRVIAACAPQMGMNASAVLSMKMIHNFRPRYIFMTGIAASVQKSENNGFGDIIVIDESWDGGAGKITQDENGKTLFLQVANHLRLDRDISEKMRAIKDNTNLLRHIKDEWKPNKTPNTELSLHIGSVASVAGVIENEAIVSELKVKDRKLMGLEMEAHGMYYSAANCSSPKPIAIAIKSISDFANTNKSDDFQTYASYTSARVMYEFIISELM
jgi:nucleoside phosphorylase/CheY-like chemotaxis protein